MDPKAQERLVRQLAELVRTLTNEQKQELQKAFDEAKGMPISVFKAPAAGLELVVTYLKDVEHKSFQTISELLSRKISTIYNTYRRAKQKLKTKLDTSDDSIRIPIEIFKDRQHAVLENIVAYLREERKLSFADIAKLLHRSYSTVRTVYRRYKGGKNE